ncbi:MAG: hypothetical protein AB7T63_13020 [Planctomycetota bacterium]
MRGACAHGAVLLLTAVLAASSTAPAWADEVGPYGTPPAPRLGPPPSDGAPLPGPVGEPALPDRLLGSGRSGENGTARVDQGPPSSDPTLAPAAPPVAQGAERPDAPYPEILLPVPQPDLDLASWPARVTGLDLWGTRRVGALLGHGPRDPRGTAGSKVHGSLAVRYRGRVRSGGQDDHDLFEALRVDVGDGWSRGWYTSFHGRLSEDLDEFGTGSSFSFWSSVADTRDHRVDARIWHAYVGVRPCGGPVEDVRVGRQDVDAGAYLHMDGIRVTTRPLRALGGATLVAFGGVPSTQYYDGAAGDLITGVSVERSLGSCTTARLDYVYIHDTSGFESAEHNHLWTAELRRRLARDAVAWLRYSHQNGNPNELEVVYDGPLRRPDVFVRVRYKALLHEQDDITYELDPYTILLQALAPYHEASVHVSRMLGRCWFVEGGAYGRWLAEGGDEARYNHEFQRFHAMLGRKDWPRRGWSLGLTGEVWTGDETIAAIGFEAEHRPSRCWRLRVGTDFQRYRTDFWRQDERLDSRSVYVDARWQPTDRWSLRVRVRYEDDDLASAWTVDTGAEVRF